MKNTAGAGRQVAERPPRAGGGEAGESGRKSGTGHEKKVGGPARKLGGTAKIGVQSSPDPKAGRYAICQTIRGKFNWFQASPDPKAGRHDGRI